LINYQLDGRLLSLDSQDLPVLAEIYWSGTSHVGKILEIRSLGDTNLNHNPTLKVQILTGNKKEKEEVVVVDIGQVTTIWGKDLSEQNDDYVDNGLNWDTLIHDQMQQIPVGAVETCMDQLYQARSSSHNQNTNGQPLLSKKQITQVCNSIAYNNDDDDPKERQHVEQVLRQVIKADARLVDSQMVADYLYEQGVLLAPTMSGRKNNNTIDHYHRRALAAHLLAQDSQAGGRFKRSPSMFVSRQIQNAAATKEQTTWTLLNGGWRAVDSSVRAGAEARKFAGRVTEEAASTASTSHSGDNHNKLDRTFTTTSSWTISDERIAQRLECLAMGEVLSGERAEDMDQNNLELDVREALKALGVPATPEAARDVLVRMGRWSRDESTPQAQPWSPQVLEAARWFSEYCDTVRSSKRDALQNDRKDLTNIPFVCVDAQRTSFRDDAIGLRPRSITGRKVSSASKWELLISIVDVSDLYLDDNAQSSETRSRKHFQTLREAATNRAVSRYDLPLGPLHLLPPVALKGLSFDTVQATGDESPNKNSYHRCVTVWVYLDETTGTLLDAGVERSVLRAPVGLSYADATSLLEGKIDTTGDKALGRTKQLLSYLYRNLNAWSQQRLETSSAAQRREDRLATKEYVASIQQQASGKDQQERRDDGSDGFQRTAGHKLVDMSLDLYSYILAGLVKRKNAFIPQQAGSEQGRGGRVATAPLRRYIDGMAQRQVLSVLCHHNAPVMTKAECIRVSQQATEAYNAVSNIRSVKTKGSSNSNNRLTSSSTFKGQKGAVQKLKLYLGGDKTKIIPAVGTGKGNDVVVKGVGAIAKVKAMKHPLTEGQEVLVKVLKMDADTGNLSVILVDNQGEILK